MEISNLPEKGIQRNSHRDPYKLESGVEEFTENFKSQKV